MLIVGIAAATAGFIGIILGYSLAPKLSNARLYQAYCKGKLSEQDYQKDKLHKLQLRIWRLEAMIRKIDENTGSGNAALKTKELAN